MIGKIGNFFSKVIRLFKKNYRDILYKLPIIIFNGTIRYFLVNTKIENIFRYNFIDALYIIFLYGYWNNSFKYIKNYDKDFFILELKTGQKFLIRKKLSNSDISQIVGNFIKNRYKIDNILRDISGKVVVDIGANIGDSAIFFAQLGGIVYAYEPDAFLYNVAIKNAELNNLSINYFNAGIGDKNIKRKLLVSKDGALASSATIFDDHDKGEFFKLTPQLVVEEEINIIKFSDIINSFESIYLVKINCEGCEVPAFNCLKNSEIKKVNHFLIVYHRREPNKIVELLAKNGFYINKKALIYGTKPNFIIANKIL